MCECALRKQKKSLSSCCFLGDSFNRLCHRHLPLVHAPLKKKCRGRHKTTQQSGPFFNFTRKQQKILFDRDTKREKRRGGQDDDDNNNIKEEKKKEHIGFHNGPSMIHGPGEAGKKEKRCYCVCCRRVAQVVQQQFDRDE